MSMRDPPIFPGNPPPGVTHAANNDGALDDADPEALDDDDGLEDESEMVVDAQPLLGDGLGLPPTTLVNAPPPPPPIPPLPPHFHHANSFSYVASHPPQPITYLGSQVGVAEAVPPPPPPPPPPVHPRAPGHEGLGDDDMDLASLTIGLGAAGTAAAAPDIEYAVTVPAAGSSSTVTGIGASRWAEGQQGPQGQQSQTTSPASTAPAGQGSQAQAPQGGGSSSSSG